MSRSQLQVLHRLGSARNASRVLKDMSDYVTYFLDGEAVYYLTKAGREAVGAVKVRKKSLQARHFVMRNQMYIALGCPSSWINEAKLSVAGHVTIIADALFKRGEQFNVVEVDNTQRMSENRAKIAKYRKLLELGVFKEPPIFYWITKTEYRRKQLLKLCEGLNVKVYTVNDLK